MPGHGAWEVYTVGRDIRNCLYRVGDWNEHGYGAWRVYADRRWLGEIVWNCLYRVGDWNVPGYVCVQVLIEDIVVFSLHYELVYILTSYYIKKLIAE